MAVRRIATVLVLGAILLMNAPHSLAGTATCDVPDGRMPFVGLSSPAAPQGSWTVECVDCPRNFGGMSSRSLQLDSDGHPHIAYGGDRLDYASYDGSTWNFEVVDSGTGNYREINLVLDQQGRAHLIYLNSLQEVKYALRDEDGWHVSGVTSIGDVGELSLAVDSQGYPHFTVYNFSAACRNINAEQSYAYQDSGGWHIEEVVGDPMVPYSGGTSSIALDKNGHPHILLDVVSGQEYAYRDEAGWHFEGLPAGAPLSYTTLAVDEMGYVHISGGYGYLKYAYRDDSGWNVEAVDSVDPDSDTSLVLDSDGFAHIGYYDSETRTLRYAELDASGWHIKTVASGDNAGPNVSLALDETGDAHLGFLDNLGKNVKYAEPSPEGWSIETVSTSDNGPVGASPSLALDDAGYAHIGYYGISDGSLRYAWQVTYDGWYTQTIDNNVGPNLSLRLDGDGHGRISYYDAANDDLKLAAQDDGGWVTQTIDTGGDVGIYSSLAIDLGGNVHISYLDADNKELEYTYQDGADWFTRTVDSLGVVADFLSLALDKKGFAHISYFVYNTSGSVDSKELRYAHEDASGWHTRTLMTVTDLFHNRINHSSLALDQNGYPYISYHYSTAYADDYNYLYLVYQDTNGWHTQEVDQIVCVGDTGLYNSTVVDAKGHVYISYYKREGLDFAYRLGSNTWIKQNVGNFRCCVSGTSLALGPDGFARIAFYDSLNGDLKFATFYSTVPLWWETFFPAVFR